MDDSIDGVLEVDRCTIVAESLVTNSEREVMAIRVSVIGLFWRRVAESKIVLSTECVSGQRLSQSGV